MKKKLTPKYNTNKSIREKIDKLLVLNARNVANSETKSKYDIGDENEVKKAWLEIQSKIKQLDSAFYDIIKSR